MSTLNKDTFSEVIDVTLYKYNSIDLKLWGIICRSSGTKKLDDDSVLVSREDLYKAVHGFFRSEINKFQAVSDVTIHKEATSIYFLQQLFNHMSNLLWVKITLNKNASYNRVVNIDQIKTIKYSIKTLRGSLRLFDIFNEYECEVATKVLRRANIFKGEEHFMVMRVKTFLNTLDLFLSEHNTTEIFNIISPIINVVENYESDDPEMLLIADKKSDI